VRGLAKKQMKKRDTTSTRHVWGRSEKSGVSQKIAKKSRLVGQWEEGTLAGGDGRDVEKGMCQMRRKMSLPHRRKQGREDGRNYFEKRHRTNSSAVKRGVGRKKGDLTRKACLGGG